MCQCTTRLRMCRLGEGVRKAVAGWGLKLLCKDPRWNSDSLTVIETPQVWALLILSFGGVCCCKLPLGHCP